ncbi:MAG: peptidylprolyl isomerase [Acidobacteria bacterium]|nr:peptidylprolyl isomerase [Acidobacteriota bacterium]
MGIENVFGKLLTTTLVILFFGLPASAQTPLVKVGGRVITMEELRRVVNSTPYAMPDAKIQPSSNQKRATLQILGEIIDSELLYQEAIASKIELRTDLRNEIDRYAKSLLADAYRQRLFAKIRRSTNAIARYSGEKHVSEEAAKALLQNEERRKVLTREKERLFDFYQVKYYPILAKTEIAGLKAAELLVSSAAFKIYFSDMQDALADSGNTKSALLDLLAQAVEVELFAAEAKKGGLDQDKKFISDAAEYGKNLTIVVHRKELEKKYRPNNGEIEAFVRENEYLRFKPQRADVLLIVARAEKEAASIRERALKGENFYRLAMDRSIAPNARINSGRIDPVIIGDHPYTSVEKALLDIKPGEITKPIKGDKGYSIFKLMAISPKELKSADELRRSVTRQIAARKMAEHVEKLRETASIQFYPAAKEIGGLI